MAKEEYIKLLPDEEFSEEEKLELGQMKEDFDEFIQEAVARLDVLFHQNGGEYVNANI